MNVTNNPKRMSVRNVNNSLTERVNIPSVMNVTNIQKKTNVSIVNNPLMERENIKSVMPVLNLRIFKHYIYEKYVLHYATFYFQVYLQYNIMGYIL